MVGSGTRSVHLLSTGKFLCSFQLSDTGILGETKMMLFSGANIRAELTGISIHGFSTESVKLCDDVKPNKCGTLMVCLPFEHYEGSLVARHDSHQCTYNWSSPVDDSAQKIHWAAFCSDAEFKCELLSKTKGYCFILNFDLYCCYPTDLVTSPYYSSLKTALDNLEFLPKGGTLGFGCQHSYILEDFNKPENDPAAILKGSDRMIYLAAKLLDLDVKIKPIIRVEEAYNEEYEDFEELKGAQYSGR